MAMTGVEVASAYVTLLPSMRGFKGRLDRELRGALDHAAVSAGADFGAKFEQGLRRWTRRGMIALGAAVTTGLGAILKKGWDRLTAIEDAQAKLRGLGHDAKTVQTIMDNALQSVLGTAFAMGDAATIAASAVAAGVKPGKELERYLKLTADAATIAGVSLSEMGSIFNRVQTQGRAYTMELNMLADRGIPIFQWLAEEYGVTADALRKMVAEGKVDAETYFRVIEKNIGGAALESANTTRGALANVGAAMSRLGAEILEEVFPLIRPFFLKLIEWLDAATEKVDGLNERISAWAKRTIKPALDDLTEGVKAFWDTWKSGEDKPVTGTGFVGFMQRMARWANTARDAVNGFRDGFNGTADDITRSGLPGWMEDLGEATREAFDYIEAKVQPILDEVGDWLEENEPLIHSMIGGAIAAVGAFAGLRGALMGVVAAWQLATFILKRSGWGWLIIGIGALVGALIGAGDETEGFGETWENVTTNIQQFWDEHVQPVLDKINEWFGEDGSMTKWWEEDVQPTWDNVSAKIEDAWNNRILPALQDFRVFLEEDLGPVLEWLWLEVVSPVFSGIGEIIASAWSDAILPNLESFAYWIKYEIGPILDWLWREIGQPVFTMLGALVVFVWYERIKPAFEDLKNFLTGKLLPAIGTFGSLFLLWWWRIKEDVTRIWERWIKPAWDSMIRKIDAVKRAFEIAKDAIGRAWEWIRHLVAKPLVAVISFVNESIIGGLNRTILTWLGVAKIPTIPIPHELRWAAQGYYLKDKSQSGARPAQMRADGGVLPGYTPGRDVHVFRGDAFDLWLSGGEAVMRPEFTRAVGKGWVDEVNAVARTRGVQGVRELFGYARGGVIGDRRGGGLVDAIVDAGKGLVDFITSANPVQWVKNLFLSGLDALTGNPFYEWVPKLVGKIASDVKDKLFELIGLGSDPAAELRASRPVGKGMHWTQIWAIVRALDPRAVLTDSVRPAGTRTRSGFISYHGLQRAIDVWSPNMMGLFVKLRATGIPWSELYYSPARGAQMRNGRPYNTYGTPAWADHFDHIHIAMARGGVLAGLYDRGGYLPPGLSLVANGTGKPEPVLTEDQWRALTEEREPMTVNIYGVPMDAAGDVATEVLYHARRASRGKYARVH